MRKIQFSPSDWTSSTKTRRRPPLPLQLDLDPPAAGPLRRGDASLHGRVREALRDAILAGRLPPGGRLPSSRTLAGDLGCARGTILLAIEQLVAEGYLTTRPGSGTRVADTLPDDLLVPRGTAGRTPPSPAAPVLSRRGASLAASRGEAGDAPIPDAFALGRPALDAFPRETWARLLQAEWRAGPPAHRHPLGDPRLRRALAAYLSAGRGVACSEEAVIVTASIRQSLRLLAELLLEPGEAAYLEEPGFPGLAHALRAAGLRTIPVPCDTAGFSIARARSLDPGARLAVVTPAQGHPLGDTMSLENRLALLAWAEAEDGWIVEDDYDGEYRYAGRPLAPLHALDRAGRVLYVGSVSKVLLPALQMSYLVLPEALVEPVRRALTGSGGFASILGQGALARFIAEGHFAAHLRRTRRLYGQRQAALAAAMRDHLGDVLEVPPRDGGMHLVARPVPGTDFDDRLAVEACARAGIATTALSPHFADPARAEQGLLLGYACVPERAVIPAVRRMAEALKPRGGKA
ncbi:PLP-dependent aminotransferase family protein [Methylobacterium bullatum]|uniref:8-amino-7-oxononanoate synthase n=2 Tax=Methylobacterium bullatum TaxID=570505 RepID=A0AAV4Z7Z6_9HYPH|nr:PLP-dependent aminotransferase family protein [Methylobacterium bullatum]GJD40158.1 HTH-type transcriptional regulatory protein GabR [Methylobacterium bullatum]